jgi:long-chain acyl-CoA synthetase
MTIQLNGLIDRLQGRAAKLIFVSESGAATEKTFDDLHRETLELADRLRQLGVRPGQRIGILGPNSYAWMQWDLAITALGCVSVAFAPKGTDSIEQLIDRYSLHLMGIDPVCDTGNALELACVVDINSPGFAYGKRVLTRAAQPLPPDTHSLVFSSGTTGKTKGLIISRAGTQKLVSLYGQAFGARADDRLLTFLPFFNYQQRMTYYFCLHHGVDFVCTPYTQLFGALRAHRPTFLIAPPMLYESVQNIAQSLGGPDPSAVATRLSDLFGGHIRYLVTGMAPIKKQTLEFFWKCGLSLYEAFGITEAGMVAWNKPGAVKVGTVGKPAEPGTVSLTSEGEVVITRDALLSLGYFEASDEDTRATFVGKGAVATGDIAEFDAEGFLTIIGRKKDAIITPAGEKFHPEPIEALIQRDPRVKVAVVTSYQGVPGTTAIIAIANADCVEVTRSITLAIDELNLSLPAHQQVREVLFTQEEFNVDNGLRTQNLKLDRRAIHAAFLARRPGAARATATPTYALAS